MANIRRAGLVQDANILSSNKHGALLYGNAKKQQTTNNNLQQQNAINNSRVPSNSQVKPSCSNTDEMWGDEDGMDENYLLNAVVDVELSQRPPVAPFLQRALQHPQPNLDPKTNNQLPATTSRPPGQPNFRSFDQQSTSGLSTWIPRSKTSPLIINTNAAAAVSTDAFFYPANLSSQTALQEVPHPDVKQQEELLAKHKHMETEHIMLHGKIYQLQMQNDKLTKEDKTQYKELFEARQRAEKENMELKKQLENASTRADFDAMDRENIRRLNDQHKRELEITTAKLNAVTEQLQLHTVEKRPHAYRPGAFPTESSFYNDGTARKKVKMDLLRPAAIPIDISPSKSVAEVHVQTDPLIPIVVEVEKLPGPIPSKGFCRMRRLLYDLNDSRPEVDEKFSLNVLIQPLARFEISGGSEVTVETFQDRCGWRNFAVTREQNRKEHWIPATFGHLVAPSSLSGSYTSFQLTQDSMSYLLFLGQEEELRNKVVSDEDYDCVLAGIIPLVTDHFRLYLSVLHNLTSVCDVTVHQRLTKEAKSLSLSELFSEVLPSCSCQRTVNFITTIERNAKLALITLRRILYFRSNLSPFYLDKICQPLKFLRHFVSRFPIFGRLLQHAETFKATVETVPIRRSTTTGNGEAANPDAASAWIVIGKQLSLRYRLDFKSQELAMVQLARITSAFSDTSVLDLCLMMMECCKFQYLPPDIIGSASWVITYLAKSFAPDNSQLREQLKIRLLENSFLFSYIKEAKLRCSQVMLAPMFELFKVVATWRSFQNTLSDSEDCFFAHLFGGLFALPFRRRDQYNVPYPPVDLVKKLPVFLHALRTLVFLRFSGDDEISLHLVQPSNRAAFDEMVQSFCEMMSLITRKLYCPNPSDQLMDDVPPVPTLFKDFINEAVLWILSMVMHEKEDWDRMIVGFSHHLINSCTMLLEFTDAFDFHTGELIKRFNNYISAEVAVNGLGFLPPS